MAAKRTITIWLRQVQVNRLNLLRAALSEKMNQEFTLGQLVERIIDDFLDSKR